MSWKDIIKDVKAKKFAPIYLLHGDEGYYIDLIEKEIEAQVLTEAEKGFNQTILYGKEADWMTMMDILRRYPMMSQYQVVILREAQQMRDIKKLEPYIKNPSPTTIFVISYKGGKGIDKRTAFGKAFKGSGVVFESKKIRDYELVRILPEMVKSKGLKINATATSLLVEHLGTDLAKVTNTIDRLAVNMESGEEITPALIEKFVGISKDYNAFEFSNALMTRDIEKAFRIVKYFQSNGSSNSLTGILAMIYMTFNRLTRLHQLQSLSNEKLGGMFGVHPFFMQDYRNAIKVYTAPKCMQALDILQEYDLKAKGVGSSQIDQYELMKEMTWKLLYV